MSESFTSFVQRFPNLYESVIIFCFALFSFATVLNSPVSVASARLSLSTRTSSRVWNTGLNI